MVLGSFRFPLDLQCHKRREVSHTMKWEWKRMGKGTGSVTQQCPRFQSIFPGRYFGLIIVYRLQRLGFVVPNSSSSNTMIAPLLHLQLLRRWEHGVMAMVTGSSYEKVDRCSYRKMGFKRERENSMPIGMKTIMSRLLLSITSGRRFH